MVESEIVEQWEQHGRKCKVVKAKRSNGCAHYCGYAKTTLSIDYDNAHIVDVHGGLTYGVDDEGWLGFDCAHSGDVCLDEDNEVMNEPLGFDRQWTVERVKEEVNKLARQLSLLEEFYKSASYR